MQLLLLLAIGVAPSASPESERIQSRIDAANRAAQTVTAEVPPDSTKEVVVRPTESDWIATYKGRVNTWPRSTAAADVVRLAGEWGQGIDSPKPVAPEVRPATTFRPLQPVQQLQPRLPAERVKPTSAIPVGAIGDKSHFCPACGAGEWRTVLRFNPDGSHSHRCEACGNVFSH